MCKKNIKFVTCLIALTVCMLGLTACSTASFDIPDSVLEGYEDDLEMEDEEPPADGTDSEPAQSENATEKDSITESWAIQNTLTLAKRNYDQTMLDGSSSAVDENSGRIDCKNEDAFIVAYDVTDYDSERQPIGGVVAYYWVSRETGEIRSIGATQDRWDGMFDISNGIMNEPGQNEIEKTVAYEKAEGWRESSSTSKSKTGSSAKNPYYGVWCAAYKSREEAEAFIQKTSGLSEYHPQIFITNQWSNLNSKKYYVVTAGVYSSKSEAKAVLEDVQRIIPDAYVKYSGEWIG